MSYIDMNQPWSHMYFPSWFPNPPPSLPDSSGSSQCTRPEHLSHASNLGWWSVSYVQNRKRDTDVQNRLLDSVGEGEGGMFPENSIETCIYRRLVFLFPFVFSFFLFFYCSSSPWALLVTKSVKEPDLGLIPPWNINSYGDRASLGALLWAIIFSLLEEMRLWILSDWSNSLDEQLQISVLKSSDNLGFLQDHWEIPGKFVSPQFPPLYLEEF